MNNNGIKNKFIIIDNDTISEGNLVSILDKTAKVRILAPTGEAVIYNTVLLDKLSKGRT